MCTFADGGHDYLHENAVANWAQHAAELMAFRPYERMQVVTPAQPMPWVKRQTTRRSFIQDQALDPRMSLTLSRDVKPVSEHHHPQLEIPADHPLLVYHSESNHYPK